MTSVAPLNHPPSIEDTSTLR